MAGLQPRQRGAAARDQRDQRRQRARRFGDGQRAAPSPARRAPVTAGSASRSLSPRPAPAAAPSRANSITCWAPSPRISSAGEPSLMMPAVVDDGHAVAQPLGLFHVVRGQHDRAARASKAQHQLPQLAARLRIQPGGRLVEEQDVGLAHQRARDRQPLPLAARQLADPRVALLRQLDVGQQRRRPAAPAGRSCGTGPASRRPSAAPGSRVSCSATPIRSRSAPRRVAHDRPQQLDLAGADGSRSPSRISTVVVLPAPFGPSRPKHSPRRIPRSSPSTATTAAPGPPPPDPTSARARRKFSEGPGKKPPAPTARLACLRITE